MFYASSKKGIGILITLVFLSIALIFISNVNADGVTLNLCYLETAQQCTEYNGDCAEIGGIINDNTICEEGCCCYTEDGKTEQQSIFDVSSKYCTDKYNSQLQITPKPEYFYNQVYFKNNDKEYNPKQCTLICDQEADQIIIESKPQCSDEIDNDNDNLIDLFDQGCTDINDNSEVDTQIICKVLPNKINPDKCDCSGAECTAGQYCYASSSSSIKSCQTIPPKNCNANDKLTVSFDEDGCQMIASCDSITGLYETAIKEPNCPTAIEICNSKNDLNLNDKIGCNDLACVGLPCSVNPPSADFDSLCKSKEVPSITKAKLDSVNQNWVCCLNQAYDCNSDLTPDSCEPCDCTIASAPIPPKIIDIEHITGKFELKINFESFCQVDYSLLICKGTEADCAENKKMKDPLKWTDSGITFNAKSFSHTNIIPNTNYCYAINAIYGTKIITSDVLCTKSGHKLCLQSPYAQETEFCEANSEDIPTFNTEIYYCDKKNQLHAKDKIEIPNLPQDTTCALKSSNPEKPSYFCAGPNENKESECIYQSPCIFCGVPFNMYGNKETSKLLKSDDDNNNELCKNIDVCYYDFTKTTADAFTECKDVSACSDYKSQGACNSIASSELNPIPNNKCLTRNCIWETIADELNLGVCKEKDSNFNKCSACETSEHNSIFDYCDVERCKSFSSDDMKCYPVLIAELSTCQEEIFASCNDYQDSKECTGNSGTYLVVDVTYVNGKRTAGTNSITASSQDYLNIGTCRWTAVKGCFKDADYDGFKDPGDVHDITPPKTQLLSSLKTQKVNLQFSVSDESPKGRPSTGVKKTYYCYQKSSETNTNPCYPTIEYDPAIKENILPIDHGLYNLRFYSEDNAHNLEVVQTETINVDRQPPKITINYNPILDKDYPYSNSAVVITVSLDETATCTDKFESKETQNKIDDDFGSLFQAKYEELYDGIYRYTVTCQDELGNKGAKTIYIKIDADIMIQNSQPTGVIDDKETILEITTLEDGACSYNNNGVNIPFTEKEQFTLADKDAYKFSAVMKNEDNKEYSYPISCLFNGKTHTDEIQFVLDTTSPTTAVIDINNLPFDSSKFYTAQSLAEKIFLYCKDIPQTASAIEIGFGCKETKYCTTDKAEGCNPNKVYDPIYSIDDIFTASTSQWLCYYSIENIINSTENIINGEGGLSEAKKCIKLNQDIFNPEIDVEYLAQYEQAKGGAENPLQVYGNEYTLEITVTDKDAVINPPANNFVAIEVTSLSSAEGQLISKKENIAVNNKISEKISLVLGINQIIITAKDRSNQVTSKTYYIELMQITDKLIQLLSPVNGITDSPKYDFIIKLKDGISAESCLFSNNANFGGTYQFDKTSSKEFRKEDMQFLPADEGIPKPFYVKCKLQGSIETTEGFILIYDNTKPVIKSIALDPSNNNIPAAIIQPPIIANITVVTDDNTRCRIFDKPNYGYKNMLGFTDYNSGKFSTVNKQEVSDKIENPLNILRIEDKKSYTYYIQCDNGLDIENHTSDIAAFTFKVDTSIGSEINIISPKQFSTTKEQQIILETIKQVNFCSYGNSEDNITINLTTIQTGSKAFKEHKSAKLIFPEGKYTYYFSCQLKSTNGFVHNYITFTIDTTPPVFKSIDDSVISSSYDSLSAVFNFEDNLSGIKYYTYSIGTKAKANDILNATNSSDSKVVKKGLILKNNSIYYWNVFAVNNVELSSEQKSSDGVLVSIPNDLIPPQKKDLCKNGIKDNNETAIDCGGKCSACLNDAGCKQKSDCASNICVNNVCKKATCDDGILNQGETDVDCGGNSCDACKIGLQCQLHSDCITKSCKADLCVQSSCIDGLQNGDETAVDCGGSKCTACKESTPIEDDELITEPKSDSDSGMGIGSILMLIFLVLILLGAGGYYYYTNFMQKSPQEPLSGLNGFPPATLTSSQSSQNKSQNQRKIFPILQKMDPELKKKKDELKKKQREQLLGKFDNSSSLSTSSTFPASSTEKTLNLQEKPELAKSAIKSIAADQKSDKKKDSLQALASSVKGKTTSKNAIEELRGKLKNKNKKSQTSEMFTYLLGIIIIGLLLFLGVKYILKLNHDISEINLLSFKTSIETKAADLSAKYGSWSEEDFTVPVDVKKVCFFDISKTTLEKENTKLCGGQGLNPDVEAADQKVLIELCDSWKKNVNNNVMTVPFVAESPIFVKNLKVDSAAGYICKSVISGKITVTITGLGNGVKFK